MSLACPGWITNSQPASCKLIRRVGIGSAFRWTTARIGCSISCGKRTANAIRILQIWMDHEFSTSQLQADQAGWDWISLQMDDGTDWMFYQLRKKDGERDSHSSDLDGSRILNQPVAS